MRGWVAAIVSLVVLGGMGPVDGSDGRRPGPDERARLAVAGSADMGAAVAVGVDTVVVGDPGDDSAGNDAGAVYVFRRDAGGPDAWGLVATLRDGGAGARFGQAVAIDGQGADTVAVGAPSDAPLGVGSGAVHVYHRNAGGADRWGRVAVLTPHDGSDSDEFGAAVAIRGSRIVAGAPRADAAGSDAGAAYVFERMAPDGAWSEVGVLTADDPANGDGFGRAVAVDGPTIVVGAPSALTAGVGGGAAYVFEVGPAGSFSWSQVARLSRQAPAAGDGFGAALGVRDDTLVVGLPGDDGLGEDTGAGIVFTRAMPLTGADRWVPVATLTAPTPTPGARLGAAASIGADRVVLGAPGDSAGGGSGTAHVFERNADGADRWGQFASLSAADGAAGDRFGAAVALSGTTVVAGAPDGGSSTAADPGVAHVMNLEGCDWYAVADYEGPLYWLHGHTWFGASVALSGDTMVVGAPQQDGSGVVHVFERNVGGGDRWGLVTSITEGGGQLRFNFGTSVALDGSRLVVGAPGDPHAGDRSGSAYVFERHLGGVNAWGRAARLTAADAGPQADFGQSVAVSGDTVVVGACEVAAAYVFEAGTGEPDGWDQVTRLSGGARFGCAVAVDGDHAIVGAYSAQVGTSNSGAAHVYRRFHAGEAGVERWGEIRQLTADDAGAHDQFGRSVAIRGDKAVIGAPGNDGVDHRGAAYVFQRNDVAADSWVQLARLTSGVPAKYGFGGSVSFDADSGATIVVGTSVGVAYALARGPAGPASWNIVSELDFGTGGPVVAVSDEVAALADRRTGEVRVYYRACPVCGDSIVEPPEQCEDGNTVGGDGCSADCFSDESCGNGILDPSETCDDGDVIDGDGCDSNCTPTGCGNGVASFPEQCDDGNTVGGDGCSANCLSDETCGNGVLDPGEECDDGNNADGDRCRGDCRIEGACCEVTAGAARCRGVVEADCTEAGGRFLGSGTDCASFHCSCESVSLTALSSANPQPGRLGPSVAMRGDTLVANVSSLSGALQRIAVFERDPVDPAAWAQTAALEAPGHGRPAVDPSGTLVVATATLTGVGSFVYAFERDPVSGEWDAGIRLFPGGPDGPAGLGRSVATDGERIVTGDQDSVYIFERSAGGWVQTARLEGEGNGFGRAVSIVGDILAVGAWLDDDVGNNAGAAYLFRYRSEGEGSGAWSRVAKLRPTPGVAGIFGAALALDSAGEVLVVGAYGAGPVYESGAASVFGRNVGGPDAWGRVTDLRPPEPKLEDYFGISVAIDGDTIVVGAVDGEGDAIYAGAAYVFRRNARGPDRWGQVATLRAGVREDGDYFGRYVAVSGDTFAVGTLGHNVIYTGTLACSDCGDGSTGLFEVCDDGNRIDGDGCSSSCEPGCGTGLNRFVQPVLALDRSTFGWSQPVDAVWVRGDLGFAGGYGAIETGSLPASTGLTGVPDPPAGSGSFVLLRIDCPESTWSSGGRGECYAGACDRDGQLPAP